jgi:integrase
MEIPLSLIEKYRNNRTNGKVFPIPEYPTVLYHLKKIDRQCELNKGLSYHVARHTFASLITLSEGVPIETVSKMLGHQDIATTQTYAEVSTEKMLKDILVLSEKINNKYILIN